MSSLCQSYRNCRQPIYQQRCQEQKTEKQLTTSLTESKQTISETNTHPEKKTGNFAQENL